MLILYEEGRVLLREGGQGQEEVFLQGTRHRVHGEGEGELLAEGEGEVGPPS